MVKITIFYTNVVSILDLHFKLNFDQFCQSISDLFRIHTTKVGPFILVYYASDNNKGNEIPKFFSVLFFVLAYFKS